jgi:hypothetical protein
MPNKVFVSPGVYTSEKDLSYVTKSIGVTTLGLVGETTKGPAFQPIFVQDWGEFVNFFGERNASKNKNTNYANYELPYVAKEYLSQSNQLFVTRVLGLSGYDAGKAWAITLDADIDVDTIQATIQTSFPSGDGMILSSNNASWTINPVGGFAWVLDNNVVPGNYTTQVTAGRYVTSTYIDEFSTQYTISYRVLSSSFDGVNTTIVPDWGDYGYIPIVSGSGPITISGQIASLNDRFSNLFTFTADSSNNITAFSSSDSFLQTLYNLGLIDDKLTGISLLTSGSTLTFGDTVFNKTGNSFSGLTIHNWMLTNVQTSGSITTGQTSGITAHYAGTSYSDVEDKVVALLRSRGYYDGNENLTFEVTGGTYPVAFDTSVQDSLDDAKGKFTLTGTSSVSGAFTYDLSFNKSKNNYITKVLGRNNLDGKTSLFVEEVYQEMLDNYYTAGKVKGLNLSLVDYGSTKLSKYKNQYQPAQTPWVVSELRGSNIFRLFRFWTISDGNSANKQFKISISNVRLDDKEFDVTIRNYYDTDANPQVFEKYTKLSMDPNSNNFIGKRIGTLNGDFPSKSNYVLVEMDETSDTSDAFPAGFTGYPVRKYEDTLTNTAVSPSIFYRKNYGSTTGTATKKIYLGISNTISANSAIEDDLFTYKGVPESGADQWTGMTKGFHMDIAASAATIDNIKIPVGDGNFFTPTYEFETGADEFRTETGAMGTSYEKIYTRKFTFVPFGGYDGWDIYRADRTNTDTYTKTGSKGVKASNNGTFTTIALSNGDNGINSDYYAYLEAIWTFKNPEEVNINVFATPGINMIDHSNLHEDAIEMIEADRADSLYVTSVPDTDASGDVRTSEDIVDSLDTVGFDSNYTATYWPWVQINDTYNNVYMWIPPTADVLRNIAYTDKVRFPWFAVAGIDRGNVNCIKARVKLTQEDRDTLYEGRINPVTTFATDGVKIWGNKTLQVADTALNRINVRRLLLQARKLISAVSIRLLFEQNDSAVRAQFLTLVNPILDNIRAERGLTDFRVVLKDTPESIDRGELVGEIHLKPTRALEYVILDFTINNTGASFDNI